MKKRIAFKKRYSAPPSQWDRPRLQDILHEMKGKRILVIGDVGIDRYTIGTAERISPEAPVPIVLVEKELFKLGLAANVADNVKALGGRPVLTGVVGRDRTGDDFKKLLVSSGIPSSHLVTDSSRRTVLKDRIVSERQQLLRVDFENTTPIGAKIQEAVLKKVRQLVKKSDAVILEDYSKGLLKAESVKAIVAMAKKAGKITLADPNSKTPLSVYQGVTVLTPNKMEAEFLSGISIIDDRSLLRAGMAILKKTRCRNVVLTRGKDGMAVFSSLSSRQGQCQFIPTFAKEVYDVSGAGDTVVSVLALALAAGSTMEEAAILANLAAGVEVGKRGTATVSTDEIFVALEFFGTVAV